MAKNEFEKKCFFFIMAKNECLFNEQVVRRFNKKILNLIFKSFL